MQKYLIDTNILIELMRKNKSIIQKFEKVGINQCAISLFSLCELYFGAYNIKNKTYMSEEFNKINFISQKFCIIQDIPAPEIFGQTKAYLYDTGKKVDDMDILIGSLALTKDMIVVTDNVKHFSRMQNVKFENWMER